MSKIKKLSIWQGVLCDWTCGMIVALYDNKKDLKKVFDNTKGISTSAFKEMADKKPVVHISVEVKDNVESFIEHVSGGG